MNLGSRLTENCAAPLSGGRHESLPTRSADDDWLHRSAWKFRQAITLRVPVGFQDAEGFHCLCPTSGENSNAAFTE
jgi:ABC-type antimicrobial peptide transport system ATPase subunit